MQAMRLIVVILALFLAVAALGQYVSPLDQEYIDANRRNNFGAYGQDYNSPGNWHCGRDISCEPGTPVRAAAGGTIFGGSPSGWDSPLDDQPGKRKNFGLKIKSVVRGKTTLTIYGHMMRPLKSGQPLADQDISNYRVGEMVKPGEVIGFIGHWADGNHLHIAVAVGEIPISGFGRQPLPRPQEQFDCGVRAFGIWRDPLAWINSGIAPSGVDNFLPAATSDGTGFYFVRDNASGRQQVMLSDSSGRIVVSVTALPREEEATVLFPGPGSDLFAITLGPDGRSLWKLSPGREPSRLVLSTSYFECGHYFSEANYLPIRLGGKWQAVDFTGRMFKPSDLLTVGGVKWQLIGSCGEAKSYLARHVVGADDVCSEAVLYKDDTASLESMCIFPLQPDWNGWGKDTADDIVWLRKDMSGTSIRRGLLCKGMAMFGGYPPLDIPHYDKNWNRTIYDTANEVRSCTVVGKTTPLPIVLFDERVAGTFKVRAVDLSGKNVRDVIR